MSTNVESVKSRELAKKVSCPACRTVHVIRKTGKYRCSKCQGTFRGVFENTRASDDASDETSLVPEVGPGVFDMLGATFTSFVGALPRGLALMAAPALVTALATTAFTAFAADSLGTAVVVGVLLAVLAMVLSLVGQLGLFRATQAVLAHSEQPALARCFAVGVGPVLKLGWTQLVASILIALVLFALGLLQVVAATVVHSPIVMLGVMLATVGVIVVMALRYMLAGAVVAYEGKSGLDALNRSSELVRASIVNVVLASIAMAVVLVAFGAASALVQGSGVLGFGTGLVVNALSGVLVQSFVASVYWGVRTAFGPAFRR